jgi:hypothetical protein
MMLQMLMKLLKFVCQVSPNAQNSFRGTRILISNRRMLSE